LTDGLHPTAIAQALAAVFSELVAGPAGGEAVALNPGDIGLVGSLARLSATDASRSADGGATIAAHARHLAFGLSLLNQWAREGGDPFADAGWDEAWRTTTVDDGEWEEVLAGLRRETHRWLETLATRQPTSAVELSWLVGSIAHLAYHLGAVRQIHRAARGPRQDASGGAAASGS
jgi:hypothetical protein